MLSRLYKLGFTALLLGMCSALAACQSPSGSPALRLKVSQQLELSVLPGTYLDGGTAGGFSIASRMDGGQLVAEISVQGAAGLKALYCEIRSGGQAVSVVTAEPSAAFSGGKQVLSLALADPGKPSLLHFGMVLANYQRRSGFSGDGAVATLRLRHVALGFGPRTASAAPDSNLSRAALTLSVGEISWLYYSQGDYDQNGEVNISDLTPLGAHFGESGPFDQAQAISCIDGDNNGELNIADITPIGQNFSHRLSGYHVFVSTSNLDYPAGATAPNGPGAVQLAEVPFHSTQSAPGERKRYYLDIPGVQSGDCLWVRPYDGAEEGTPSNGVSPSGFWHLITIADGETGSGTGAWCSLAVIDGQPAIAYHSNGDPVYIRANDSMGESWGEPIKIVEDPAPNGVFISLAPINNLPAVVFCYVGGKNPMYVLASDAVGAAWREPVWIQDAEVYRQIRLAEVNHYPAVAYDTAPNPPEPSNVIYERAKYADGTDWSEPARQINGGAVESQYAELAVVDGKPAVAFWQVDQPLIFRYSLDINGNAWAAPVTVHTDGAFHRIGLKPCLAVVSGQPAISYQVHETGAKHAPYYVRADDAQGANLWTSPAPVCLDLRDPDDSGDWNSMVVSGAKLYVAYRDYGNGQLRCATANDAIGTSWQESRIVDAGGGNSVGGFCSMVDANGHPAIAYFDESAEALKYAVLY